VYNFPDWSTAAAFFVRPSRVAGFKHLAGPLRLGQNVEVTSGFFGNFMRPDVVPGVPVKLPNVSWPNSSYNINAFAMNPKFDGVYGDPSTFGTVGRNSLRGPAFAQWDLSGIKNFALTGQIKLQFRADISIS